MHFLPYASSPRKPKTPLPQVGMEAYDIREFYSACDNLADRGLIGLAGGREAKWRRVTLRVRPRRASWLGCHTLGWVCGAVGAIRGAQEGKHGNRANRNGALACTCSRVPVHNLLHPVGQIHKSSALACPVPNQPNKQQQPHHHHHPPHPPPPAAALTPTHHPTPSHLGRYRKRTWSWRCRMCPCSKPWCAADRLGKSSKGHGRGGQDMAALSASMPARGGLEAAPGICLPSTAVAASKRLVKGLRYSDAPPSMQACYKTPTNVCIIQG